jgi:hypothetical protein
MNRFETAIRAVEIGNIACPVDAGIRGNVVSGQRAAGG